MKNAGKSDQDWLFPELGPKPEPKAKADIPEKIHKPPRKIRPPVTIPIIRKPRMRYSRKTQVFVDKLTEFHRKEALKRASASSTPTNKDTDPPDPSEAHQASRS